MLFATLMKKLALIGPILSKGALLAAVAAIRRELGRKWALGVVLWQCAIAWAAALIIRLIGMIC